MEPKLLAVAGPLEGATFALTATEVWIGRDPMNHLCLSDPLVSRRHCVVAQKGEQFWLRDPGSSNDTLVNDVPVREKLLADGDRIKIGDSLFLFVWREDDPTSSPAQVQLDDDSVVTRTTVTLSRAEAFYLQPEKVLAALPASARVARDLNALLKISGVINQIRRLPELQQRLLELSFEVVPAEFGAIILAKERFNDAGSFVWLSRQAELARPVKVSRTIVERVMREGVAILSNDVAEGTPLSGVPSLAISRVQSLLAVPLALYDQVLGVIYLDSSDSQVCFDKDHLQLVTAIAGIAAAPLENVRQLEWLEGETIRMQTEINLEHEMIGESEPMRAVYQLIAKVAPADSTVLLRGESGTGKELAARAIHRRSPRAHQPFMAINCAGLSETLLESDLFGHEKGSFTGAVSQKKGRLEMADGGTVFLDEMGELPLPLQAKLLRVLQTREFERVGGTRTIKADIRIIAATNRNLEAAVNNGGFRSDLYYRLNVVSLTMPPLRARRDDIPLLAHYFAMKYSQKCKRQVKGLAPATRALLTNYDWPGNVRELENAIERAVVLGTTEMILPEDLPEALHETMPPPQVTQTKYHAATKEAKKQLILQTLEQTTGNFTAAAKLLGIHPNNLHRLVRNLGLKPILKT